MIERDPDLTQVHDPVLFDPHIGEEVRAGRFRLREHLGTGRLAAVYLKEW
jgi:hypothetical protein